MKNLLFKKREPRYKIMNISMELFFNFRFGPLVVEKPDGSKEIRAISCTELPADTEIVAISPHAYFMGDNLLLKLWSSEWPEVPVGEDMSEVGPMFTSYTFPVVSEMNNIDRVVVPEGLPARKVVEEAAPIHYSGLPGAGLWANDVFSDDVTKVTCHICLTQIKLAAESGRDAVAETLWGKVEAAILPKADSKYGFMRTRTETFNSVDVTNMNTPKEFNESVSEEASLGRAASRTADGLNLQCPTCGATVSLNYPTWLNPKAVGSVLFAACDTCRVVYAVEEHADGTVAMTPQSEPECLTPAQITSVVAETAKEISRKHEKMVRVNVQSIDSEASVTFEDCTPVGTETTVEPEKKPTNRGYEFL